MHAQCIAVALVRGLVTCLSRILETWISYTPSPSKWKLLLPWHLQQQAHKQLPEPV